MISKAKIKLIKGLNQRKNRQQQQLFVAEGPKLVGELLSSCNPVYIAATEDWWKLHGKVRKSQCGDCDTLTEDELSRASLLRTPQQVIALFPIPSHKLPPSLGKEELVIALDDVQDPGNLGTIVRLADWFGVTDVVCSLHTADIYNPKAVQSTMGALARVKVHYTDLGSFISHAEGEVYGTFLDGEDLYKANITPCGIIVMGNEGKGISEEIRQLIRHRLLIPSFPEGRQTTESLNVAIATSIICAEFRRRAQQ